MRCPFLFSLNLSNFLSSKNQATTLLHKNVIVKGTFEYDTMICIYRSCGIKKKNQARGSILRVSLYLNKIKQTESKSNM